MKVRDTSDYVRQTFSTKTATRRVKVCLTQGLHLRICSAIVGAVGRHRAQVSICKGAQCADAASILDLLSLAASQDTELVLIASGADAQDALQAVAELLTNDLLDHGSCSKPR